MGKQERSVGSLPLGKAVRIAGIGLFLTFGARTAYDVGEAISRTEFGLHMGSRGVVFAAEKGNGRQYPYDGIAVLSAGIAPVPPGCSSKDAGVLPESDAGPLGTLRIDAAIEAVSQRLINTVIMVGGMGGGPNGISDAEGMKQVFYKRAKELKVDVSKTQIILEQQSERTNQNLEQLKAVSRKYGLNKILLDTNDFHMLNSLLLGVEYGDDTYAFTPEIELPKWHPEYKQYIQKLREKGSYNNRNRKEIERFVVMIVNPDLKAAEAVFAKTKQVRDIVVARFNRKPSEGDAVLQVSACPPTNFIPIE